MGAGLGLDQKVLGLSMTTGFLAWTRPLMRSVTTEIRPSWGTYCSVLQMTERCLSTSCFSFGGGLKAVRSTVLDCSLSRRCGLVIRV